MQRLIDADALMALYMEQHSHCVDFGERERSKGWQGAMQLLHDAPTVAARPGWVSVEERLPEVGVIVLVYQKYTWVPFGNGAAVTIGRLKTRPDHVIPYWEFQHYRPDFKHGTIMDNAIICPGNEYVTHWMPLPELPEVKSEC